LPSLLRAGTHTLIASYLREIALSFEKFFRAALSILFVFLTCGQDESGTEARLPKKLIPVGVRGGIPLDERHKGYKNVPEI
jgi:hypothetical protein